MVRVPNILLVICDDLAWGDLSCHGNPSVRTPRLDSLADRSARIGRYCSGPLSTPARAALMTGRHPYRTAAIDTYLGRSMLHPDEVTLAQLFKRAGYDTGLFGKWHLGDCYPFRPCDRGFDDSLWHHGGGIGQPGDIGHYRQRNSYFDPRLRRQGEPVRGRGYCTDVFTEAAIDWVRARPGGRPWFAYVAFNAPHSPLEVAPEWYAPIPPELPEKWRKLYGMVANIDHNVGRLLDLLEGLGLSENTLVIFTSDHGPCPSAGHEGRSRFNAGLRGTKGTLYEGGIRVPCLLRWPQRLRPGDRDLVMNPIDWLPTLATACGLAPPDDRKIDGLDLLPVLEGRAPAPERAIAMQWHRGDVPRRYHNATVFNQRWKWYRPQAQGPDELYDLVRDPAESRNLAAEQPGRVGELIQAYDRWFEDVGATRPENYAPPRIIVGSRHERTTYLTLQDGRLLGGQEGWGPRHPAHWLIEIAQAGEYRVDVDLAGAPAGWPWVLRVGDAVCRFRTSQPDHTVMVRLGSGPATAECLSTTSGEAGTPTVLTAGQIGITGPM